jgi:hypothetical protein
LGEMEQKLNSLLKDWYLYLKQWIWDSKPTFRLFHDWLTVFHDPINWNVIKLSYVFVNTPPTYNFEFTGFKISEYTDEFKPAPKDDHVL